MHKGYCVQHVIIFDHDFTTFLKGVLNKISLVICFQDAMCRSLLEMQGFLYEETNQRASPRKRTTDSLIIQREDIETKKQYAKMATYINELLISLCV